MTNTVAWHPWSGCSPISPSCRNCYAVPSEPGELVVRMPTGFVFNGKLRLNGEQIELPHGLNAPSIIMVLPHGDLFHENAPDAWLDRVFDVMEDDARHVYMVLTKRAPRMLTYLRNRYSRLSAPPNIALGVSCEGQREADERIPPLLDAPLSMKYLVFFSLVQPINLTQFDQNRLGTVSQVIADEVAQRGF